MEYDKLSLDGLLLFKQKRFSDERGYFAECLRANEFYEITGKNLVQINQSYSKKGVLRGIHFQNPHPQGKLISVVKGEICDIAVDLRKSSPTFMQSLSFKLSEQNGLSLYVPEGFGHGYYVISEDAIINYSCTAYYAPGCEQTIRYDDPKLNVDWMFDKNAPLIISPKDRDAKLVDDVLLYD